MHMTDQAIPEPVAAFIDGDRLTKMTIREG